jgi:malate dehydrogenase (oxaloacetate-decarboxylating)
LMSEWDVFPQLATDVAMQAIEDGVARQIYTRDEIYAMAEKDIRESREMIDHLMQENFIKKPPIHLLEEALQRAIKQVK